MQENNLDNMTEQELAKARVLEKKALQMRALETTCYTCGAGAFGVFFRWLQHMTAFNDAGLVDKSAFNFLVPLMVVGCIVPYQRFLKRLMKRDCMSRKSSARHCLTPVRYLQRSAGRPAA